MFRVLNDTSHVTTTSSPLATQDSTNVLWSRRNSSRSFFLCHIPRANRRKSLLKFEFFIRRRNVIEDSYVDGGRARHSLDSHYGRHEFHGFEPDLVIHVFLSGIRLHDRSVKQFRCGLRHRLKVHSRLSQLKGHQFGGRIRRYQLTLGRRDYFSNCCCWAHGSMMKDWVPAFHGFSIQNLLWKLIFLPSFRSVCNFFLEVPTFIYDLRPSSTCFPVTYVGITPLDFCQK